jgi:tripartite-type tricarboxylate transporter receptor subunit TctC
MKRLALIAACLAAFGLATQAHSQAYPAKPIRTLVTISGVGEALCRLVGQTMSQNMGVPVIVEAMPAAGGTLAVETSLKAPPDGYTILSANPGTHVMRQFLSRQVTYDPIRDFTPITLAWETIAVVGVHPSLPVNNFRELLDYARKNPGKLSYGTSGVGTSHHMASELVKLRTGVDMVHVPYKSGAQSFQDLIAGQIPVLYGVLAQLQPAAQAGKLRIIALQNDRRFPPAGAAPIKETVPDYASPPYWTSYYGPAGMPAPIVRRLNGEINKAINVPDVKSKLDEAGFLVIGTSPEELAATMKSDIERMSVVVKSAGIRPE